METGYDNIVCVCGCVSVCIRERERAQRDKAIQDRGEEAKFLWRQLEGVGETGEHTNTLVTHRRKGKES